MANDKTTIQCAPDGPLLVRGPTMLASPDGAQSWPTGKATVLCRCGASANKPFCDGSHRAAGFSDAGHRPQPDRAASPASAGAPECRVLPAGPYELRGSFRLEGFEASGEELYLCRCGQSRNKPFCDGSHRTAGFQG
jgi:CDGSH-type Zn-finger protein